jgi:hypothetical protein
LTTALLNTITPYFLLIKKMAETTFASGEEYSLVTRLRDIEEKQKLLKERVLLIGENLVDFRASVSSDISSIKKDIEFLKSVMDRTTSAIKRLSEDLEGRASKSDIKVLQNTARMFDPLKLATIEDVKRMILEGVD